MSDKQTQKYQSQLELCKNENIKLQNSIFEIREQARKDAELEKSDLNNQVQNLKNALEKLKFSEQDIHSKYDALLNPEPKPGTLPSLFIKKLVNELNTVSQVFYRLKDGRPLNYPDFMLNLIALEKINNMLKPYAENYDQDAKELGIDSITLMSLCGKISAICDEYKNEPKLPEKPYAPPNQHPIRPAFSPPIPAKPAMQQNQFVQKDAKYDRCELCRKYSTLTDEKGESNFFEAYCLLGNRHLYHYSCFSDVIDNSSFSCVHNSKFSHYNKDAVPAKSKPKCYNQPP